MRKNSYWDDRFLKLDEKVFETSEEYVKEIRKVYDREMDRLNKEIYNHLVKLQDEAGGISLADARKLLNNEELEIFKSGLEDFTKKAQGLITPEIQRELDIVSRRVRVSRLQVMQIEIKKTVANLMSREEKGLFAHLGRTYEHKFYNELYGLQRIMGYGNIQRVDKNILKDIISKPWAADGSNFSERIWGRGDKLVNLLQDNLSRDIARGAAPDESIKNIANVMNTSKANAGRLVMTESAAINSKATRDSYNAMGLEMYQILATLDTRTSDVCQGMDDKIFELKDYKLGVTAPPFHPNCRSTTVPYFGDDIEAEMNSTRMARNPETGKSEKVENMNYKEWEKKYVKESGWDKDVEQTKSSKKDNTNSVNWDYVDSKEYKDKFSTITDDPEVNKLIHEKSLDILKHRDNTDFEDMYVIDLDSKKVVGVQRHSEETLEVTPNKSTIDSRNRYKNTITIHNHPSNLPPSGSDFVVNGYYRNVVKANEIGLNICHNGDIYYYKAGNKSFGAHIFDKNVARFQELPYNLSEGEAFEKALNILRRDYGITWKKL